MKKNWPYILLGAIAVLLIAGGFGAISYYPSVSVSETNFVNELQVTNGTTIGTVRRTSWPAGGVVNTTGSGDVVLSISPALTGAPTMNGQSLQTQLTNKMDRIQFTWTLGDGVNTVTTGAKDAVRIPRNCELSGWDVTAFSLGSGANCSVATAVWISTYAGFPPVVGGAITGATPTITTDIKATGDTSTWGTTNLTEGSYLAVNVSSVTGDPTLVNVTLYGKIH